MIILKIVGYTIALSFLKIEISVMWWKPSTVNL